MDLDLFIDVMEALLLRAKYQQSYLLANDMRSLYPKIFESIFPELKLHLNRLRLLFFVMGMDKLSFKDLGISPIQPGGKGKQAAWRQVTEIPPAANFANIRWLPPDLTQEFAVLARRRVGWSSQAKTSVIKYLFFTLFPKMDISEVKKRLDKDKDDDDIAGKNAILNEIKHQDPELARVCDLFISANFIHRTERGFSGGSVSLPEVIATIVDSANDGSLPVVLDIASELRQSPVSLVRMTPAQVIAECLLRPVEDYNTIKQYVRVSAPADSRLPVDYVADGYRMFLERSLEKLAQQSNASAGEPGEDPLSNFEGLNRNRFIALVNTLSERHLISDLGKALMVAAKNIDIATNAALRGPTQMHTLQHLKFELMYAGYFAYFAASHLQGMQQSLNEVDSCLTVLKEDPDRFQHFVQRTLLLSGEYKALRQSVGIAVKTQATAKIRAKAAAEERAAKLKELDAEIEAKAKEREAAEDELEEEQPEDEPYAEEEEEDGERKTAAGTTASAGGKATPSPSSAAAKRGATRGDDGVDKRMRAAEERKKRAEERRRREEEAAERDAMKESEHEMVGSTHAELLRNSQLDDLEVELSTTRYNLVSAMLTALQALDGYELFRELEMIAAAFKTLAYRYQENRWFKQSLDAHRVHELIHIEMEYLPVKLQHYNWVVPDLIDVQVAWNLYTKKVPRSKRSLYALGKHARRGSVELLDVLANEQKEDEAAPEAGALMNPAGTMAAEQLEMMVADCIFSGVQGRSLERFRRELGSQLAAQVASGAPPPQPGRIYKHMHALVERTVSHFREMLNGATYLTMDEMIGLVTSLRQEQLQFAPSRSHVLQDSGNPETRPYPSSVLLFHLDKFGKWNLGVDATNNFAAQQTLRVLNNLHKAKQVQFFSEFYYG